MAVTIAKLRLFYSRDDVKRTLTSHIMTLIVKFSGIPP